MCRYVASRGNLFTPDRKLWIASGSKWVTAAIIYAVIEDPSTLLTVDSRPADFLPFWNCGAAGASDQRCAADLTLTKLLAFRGGLPSPGCENGPRAAGGPGGLAAWEACAQSMFELNSARWAAAAFDVFNYDSTGLFIAGLMALHARRASAGHTNDQWPDLLREYVVAPAGITDARLTAADRAAHTYPIDGTFAYDVGGARYHDPNFPGLSGSLACSALQYANFSAAFLAGKLVSRASVERMTKSHGSSGGFAIGLEPFTAYAQGMWSNGGGLTHSLGFLGFFPWLDQRSSDSSRHLFGVFVVDLNLIWSSDIFALACAIGIPLCILTATAACAVICRTRRQRLGLGGRTSADDQGAPPHKFADMAAAA